MTPQFSTRNSMLQLFSLVGTFVGTFLILIFYIVIIQYLTLCFWLPLSPPRFIPTMSCGIPEGLNLKGLSLFLRLYTTAQSSSIPTSLSVYLLVSIEKRTLYRVFLFFQKKYQQVRIASWLKNPTSSMQLKLNTSVSI